MNGMMNLLAADEREPVVVVQDRVVGLARPHACRGRPRDPVLDCNVGQLVVLQLLHAEDLDAVVGDHAGRLGRARRRRREVPAVATGGRVLAAQHVERADLDVERGRRWPPRPPARPARPARRPAAAAPAQAARAAARPSPARSATARARSARVRARSPAGPRARGCSPASGPRSTRGSADAGGGTSALAPSIGSSGVNTKTRPVTRTDARSAVCQGRMRIWGSNSMDLVPIVVGGQPKS